MFSTQLDVLYKTVRLVWSRKICSWSEISHSAIGQPMSIEADFGEAHDSHKSSHSNILFRYIFPQIFNFYYYFQLLLTEDVHAEEEISSDDSFLNF